MGAYKEALVAYNLATTKLGKEGGCIGICVYNVTSCVKIGRLIFFELGVDVTQVARKGPLMRGKVDFIYINLILCLICNLGLLPRRDVAP